MKKAGRMHAQRLIEMAEQSASPHMTLLRLIADIVGHNVGPRGKPWPADYLRGMGDEIVKWSNDPVRALDCVRRSK